MESGAKALVILEGRDGAGKDGTIARITEHLAPRNTRAVSLPKPSNRESSEWYFQRYIRHLPAGGRARDLQPLLVQPGWRRGGDGLLHRRRSTRTSFATLPTSNGCSRSRTSAWSRSGSTSPRASRPSGLQARRDDPLKALKISDLDEVAQKKWSAYSGARDEMLKRTHTALAPWICVDHRPQEGGSPERDPPSVARARAGRDQRRHRAPRSQGAVRLRGGGAARRTPGEMKEV